MSHLVSRDEWGAPPYSPVRIGPVSDVFIHHSVTNAYGDLRATMMMLEAHARCLGHRAIDYSFCHFIDGRRAEGRGWWAAGGHTINNNSTSYGLCGIGDYRFDPVTDEIVQAFAETITEGINFGAIREPVRIRPHSDVFSTACPAYLRDAIPRIAAAVGGTPFRRKRKQMVYVLLAGKHFGKRVFADGSGYSFVGADFTAALQYIGTPVLDVKNTQQADLLGDRASKV